MTIKCLTISRYSTSSPIYTIILDKSIPNISIDSDKIASKVKALRCKIDQRQLLKSEYGNWWVVHDRNDIIYALLTDPNYPQRHAYGLIQKLKQKTKQIPHAQYQTEDNIKLNIQKRADQLVNQYRDLTKIDKLAKANHQVNMLSGQIGTGIKKLIANQQTLTQMQSRAQTRAAEFQQHSNTLQRMMYWRNMKLKILIALCVIGLIGFIILIIVLSVKGNNKK